MARQPKTTAFPIIELEENKTVQVRPINTEVVADYTLAYKDGKELPPVIAYSEKGSKRYLLADGFHRKAAASNAGLTHIPTEIRDGGVSEALRHALGANTEHGLRRSRADKRRAVTIALKHPEFGQLSARLVADLCRVDHKTVTAVRNDLVLAGELGTSNTTTGKDGKQYPAAEATEPEVGNSPPEPSSNDPLSKPPTNGARKRQQREAGAYLASINVVRLLPYSCADALDFYQLRAHRNEIAAARDVLAELVTLIDGD